MKQSLNITVLVLLAFFVFALLYATYLRREAVGLQTQVQELQKKLKSQQDKNNLLAEKLKQKEEEIAKKDELIETHKTLISALRKGNNELSKKYDTMLRAVDEAARSVTLFKKRAEADEMLLAKYSKVFFLNEHYAPTSLSLVPSNLTQNGKQLQIKTEVLPFLQKMLQDMQSEGLDPKVVSAYRSFEQQKHLKGVYLQTYGAGANKFSSDQGYSEHQLGTTVDITRNGDSLTLDFENTDEFKWLQNNAWRYGFVLSYPKDNSYYMYEPWHWRFVGVKLAEFLHKNNKSFYDLPQNQNYNYLIDIFDVKPKTSNK